MDSHRGRDASGACHSKFILRWSPSRSTRRRWARRLQKSIVQPLLSPSCDHCRSLQAVHEVLLKSIKEITGEEASFIIRWN
ncbi:hypothetical protein X734_19980 [Mesorhizobium sp. L2C084A000]|nr:hypothetical protein X734_19980 [Mesorhizobium sp. L2C084A000]RUW87914.1 hypothetical protein EOA19_31885 [Mesorhizobium sp. M7A.F.Ca.US.010.02.1.1]